VRVAAITLCAVLMFSNPAGAHHNANNNCTTVAEDIKHLAILLTARGEVGKVWLWSDKGFSMTITASTLFEKGDVVLSFYNRQGCLIPHPNTRAIRTSLPVSDEIKALIARSQLLWRNTERVVLSATGKAI